jgi:hypothetical protein
MEAESLKTEESADEGVLEERKFNNIFDYNFQDNEKFIEGWKKVRDVIPKQKLYESLVRAEVFFYSRYCVCFPNSVKEQIIACCSLLSLH